MFLMNWPKSVLFLDDLHCPFGIRYSRLLGIVDRK